MDFFDWVIVIDVIAVVAIAALILALSISRAAQARSDLTEAVRRIVLRTPRSKSGAIRAPALTARHRLQRGSPLRRKRA